MRKWISVACIIALTLAMLPSYTLPVTAVDTSGKCGDNLTWKHSGGKLTISGTGPMYDYSEENRPPWYGLRNYYSNIVIEFGVTSIGNYAFADCGNVYDPIIPASVTSIGKMAFASCGKFYYSTVFAVFFEGLTPEIADDAFYNTKARCYTHQWSEESKQNYSGTISWYDLQFNLNSYKSNRLVGLNEELKIEDIVFEYKLTYTSNIVRYTPRQFTFSAYDNSTYGPKTATITIDGIPFEYIYFVTDGTNHLDWIEVAFPDLVTVGTPNNAMKPVVTMGGVEIPSDYYGLKYEIDRDALIGQVTITGNRLCQGFKKTFYYPLLKVNLSASQLNDISAQSFLGEPLEPHASFTAVSTIEKNKDFITYFNNNINVGTATMHAVGTGRSYGHTQRDFEVSLLKTTKRLKANEIVDEGVETDADFYVDQMVLTPSEFVAETSLGGIHMAAYNLYKLENHEYVLVDEVVTEASEYDYVTAYTYDFSSIYKGSVDQGGEIYVLSYSWANIYGSVYAGMLYLIIPAEVSDATSMTMTRIEDQDYQWEYLSVAGDDGVLGDIQWTSSDTSIAEVEDGIVSMKKPGTATITAKCGNLVASHTVSASLQDLSEGRIFDYFEESGAIVLWDNRLLTEGTDYTITVTEDENGVTVTATGMGWFTGELMKTFSGMEHLTDPNPHTHGFTNSCDSTCNGCDFTRDRDHTFSTEWGKDLENHYHECTVCGEQKDITEHTLTGNGKECTVCGRLWTPGDIDGNGLVNRDDVIALLLHVSMPAAFPISIPADYTGDDQITRDDVIQLLLHISMPDAFPLQ